MLTFIHASSKESDNNPYSLIIQSVDACVCISRDHDSMMLLRTICVLCVLCAILDPFTFFSDPFTLFSDPFTLFLCL